MTRSGSLVLSSIVAMNEDIDTCDETVTTLELRSGTDDKVIVFKDLKTIWGCKQERKKVQISWPSPGTFPLHARTFQAPLSPCACVGMKQLKENASYAMTLALSGHPPVLAYGLFGGVRGG